MPSALEDFAAGAIVSLVCTIGTILMVVVIAGSYRIPSMQFSFGVLIINQNLAALIACIACFLVFFFGYTIELDIAITYSYLFGGVTVYMLHTILISFLLISLNRLCAIAFPLAYKIVFGQKFLIALLAFNWIVPLVFSTFLLIFKQCTFAISHHGWYFKEIRNENCGLSLTIYIIYPQMALIILTMFADLLTLCLLLILRNRIFRLKSAEIKKRELNFARQVLVQGFVFLMHGFWYGNGRNFLPWLSEEWKIFWTTSFSSNLLHVFDPMIVFLCNLEFRKWLLQWSQKKQVQRITTIRGLSSSLT